MKEDQHDLVHRVCGQTLRLLPERAVYWQEEDVLLAADLHLGKEATFRAAGIPLPEGPSGETLKRLAAVLRRTGAAKLIVLGDFFHGNKAIPAVTPLLEEWRHQHQHLVVELVVGSHDRWSGEIPEAWRIKAHRESLLYKPFTLRHYPKAVEDGYCLAGHLHPGYRL